MFRVIFYPKSRDSPEIEDFTSHAEAAEFIDSLRIRRVPFETSNIPPYGIHRWDV